MRSDTGHDLRSQIETINKRIVEAQCSGSGGCVGSMRREIARLLTPKLTIPCAGVTVHS